MVRPRLRSAGDLRKSLSGFLAPHLLAGPLSPDSLTKFSNSIRPIRISEDRGTNHDPVHMGGNEGHNPPEVHAPEKLLPHTSHDSRTDGPGLVIVEAVNAVIDCGCAISRSGIIEIDLYGLAISPLSSR